MIAHPERRKGTWATPLAIFIMTIVTGMLGWSLLQVLQDVKDNVSTVNQKTDKLFNMVGEIKSSFDDYKVSSEGRFARLETLMKVRNDP